MLYFNGNGRICPLSISPGNNNGINVSGLLAGGMHCLPRRQNADLCLMAYFFLFSFGKLGTHAIDI